MNITSSESKEKFEISGKGLITSLGFKAKVRPQKYKKARYSIGNVSKKYLFKIIKEFEKTPYENYEKKRPNHEPTDSYFYLARQLAKFMKRADTLNSHSYPVRMEITALYLHVCSTNEDEQTCIILHETLSQSCSTDEDESKGTILHETLSQIFSIDKDDSKVIIANETLLQSCSTD